MRYCKLKFCFAYQNFFFKIRESFCNKMLVRSKFFRQFVEKIEKLKLSLTKQHNKMLKIRSKMLKIRKNVKIIKLEKNSREFPESRKS